MKFIHQHLRIYLPVSIFALLIGCLFLIFTAKVDGHLFVNSTHTPVLDFFFTYFTHVGGGTFVVIGSLILSIIFWNRHRFAIVLMATINLLLVAGISQFLKHIVFSDASRPIQFIGRKLLHTAPGVEMHTSNSFPSGHTAAGFAFFALVALLYGKNKWVQFFCAIAAILVGYSRIYLSQHFLEDAVLGGIVGLGCFYISYTIVKNLGIGKSLKSLGE
ncbi:MAG: phosphatase PAP2 family protein [Crocinitomicaceae bacterium]|nr:phosphatase PAP2 family protein [Flavobacteriales bacterium]NQZ34547.1 phosphatase PAP2 family protein [Crocinitomicaceae bacterium]